jgi:hypothetical protein
MPEDEKAVDSEKHYPIPELARLWGLSPQAIRRLLAGETRVLGLPSISAVGRVKRPECYFNAIRLSPKPDLD